MTYRSHTETEIREALRQGLGVWKLDTGNDGSDDILIGAYDEVVLDVLYYHDLEVLPKHWELCSLNSRKDSQGRK